MVLVVDDDKSIRLSLKLILERNEFEVVLAEEPHAAIQVIRDNPAVELVLMDMNYNTYRTSSNDGEEGLTLLKQIKVFRPDMPCILMTAWGTIDLAVRGMRAGAFDFITKPWDNGVLLERIQTARTLKGRVSSSDDKKEDGSGTIIGSSLTGILSTLIAEAIHRQSKRANGPFVKVNLGGISSSLFESEMFGHKKGSFTDATADRIGRFELAKGGTIFLDEIGELSLASQVKLLRVLQDQTYEVLGDSHTRRTDVRVVCATNADLRAMVEEKTFREDLFYRINLINLHLPPLRERREDIPLLVEHFLREACRANNIPVVTASHEAIAYLQTLPFPGNIRELKNLVERALLMHNPKGDKLTAADFAAPSHPAAVPPASPEGPAATLDDMERTAIAACIQKHSGNLSLVAKELGISRGALYRKIEKHGL